MTSEESRGQRGKLYRVLLAFVSLGISLVLMEFGLRILAPIPVPSGSTEAPKAAQYGWAMEPNAVSFFYNPDTGQAVRFRTNSQGWKDVEHSFEKPDGVVRILFIGDSVTFGITALEDTYHRQVERLLHERGYEQVEVIGIGVSAWGLDQELEVLINEGVRYDPDIVIYQFSANDLHDILRPFAGQDSAAIETAKPFRYVLGEDGQTLQRIALEPTYVSGEPQPTGLQAVLVRSVTYYHITEAVNAFVDLVRGHGWEAELASYTIKSNPTDPLFLYPVGQMTPELGASWRLLEALLVAMQDAAREQGAEFAVFSREEEQGSRTFRLRWGLAGADETGDFILWEGERYPMDYSRPNEELTELADRNNIALILPMRTYDSYEYDHHPNAAGNLAMAEDIVDYLLNWDVFLEAVGGE